VLKLQVQVLGCFICGLEDGLTNKMTRNTHAVQHGCVEHKWHASCGHAMDFQL
jgi:hypothetical protein